MGCMCSSALTYHDEKWVFPGLSEENFKKALNAAVPDKLPKYKIMDKDREGNDAPDAHTIILTRTTDMHGFIDDMTLKLSTNDKGQLVVVLHSGSRVGLNDWGQNKRNCAQLKAGLAPIIKSYEGADPADVSIATEDAQEKKEVKEEKKEEVKEEKKAEEKKDDVESKEEKENSESNVKKTYSTDSSDDEDE